MPKPCGFSDRNLTVLDSHTTRMALAIRVCALPLAKRVEDRRNSEVLDSGRLHLRFFSILRKIFMQLSASSPSRISISCSGPWSHLSPLSSLSHYQSADQAYFLSRSGKCKCPHPL